MMTDSKKTTNESRRADSQPLLSKQSKEEAKHPHLS